MDHQFWSSLALVFAASGIGFATSAVFAGWMKLSRRRFLIPYVSLVGVFLYGFIALNEVNVAEILIENWVLGILAGNSLITLAFILSGNPFGSILSHTAMHVAAAISCHAP